MKRIVHIVAGLLLFAASVSAGNNVPKYVGVTSTGVPFASLFDSTKVPQTDGTIITVTGVDGSATTCAAGSVTRIAQRIDGAWICNPAGGSGAAIPDPLPLNQLRGTGTNPTITNFSLNGFLDPKAYGVLCDGSDDTAHVQALLDAEKAASAGTTILWGPCVAKTTKTLYYLQSGNNTQGLNILGAGRFASGLDCQIPATTPLTPSDGVTNGTTTVTSASSNFTDAILNATISGTDIPSTVVPVVSKRVDAHTLVLSQSATGSHSGITFTITPITPCLEIENTSLDGSHITWGTHISDFGITSTAGVPDYGIYNKFLFDAVYDRMRITHMAKDGIHIQSDVGDPDAQVNTTIHDSQLWSNGQWAINSSCPIGINLSFLRLDSNSMQANLFGGLRFQGSGITSVGNAFATNGDNADGHGGMVLPIATSSTLQLSSLNDDFENNSPRHIDIQTCLRCTFDGTRFRSSSNAFPTGNGVRLCDDNFVGSCQDLKFVNSFISVAPSFTPYTLFQLAGGTATASQIYIEDYIYQTFGAAGQVPFSDPTVAHLTDLRLSGSKAWKASATTIPTTGWNGDIDLSALGGTPPYYYNNVALTAAGAFSIGGIKGIYDGRPLCLMNKSGAQMTVIANDAGRSAADVVENNSTTITSATLAFVTATDVGRPATGSSIPATTLTGAITLPLATIPVTATTGFTNGVATIGIAGQVISCTGTDATDFTGCTGGVGAVANGAAVNTVIASVTNVTTAVLSQVATNNAGGNTVTLGGSTAGNRIWDSGLANFVVNNDGAVCLSYPTVAGNWVVTGAK